ncbi:MAG: hypothetical protein RL885_28745 [Planctomycetota bacterium]
MVQPTLSLSWEDELDQILGLVRYADLAVDTELLANSLELLAKLDAPSEALSVQRGALLEYLQHPEPDVRVRVVAMLHTQAKLIDDQARREIRDRLAVENDSEVLRDLLSLECTIETSAVWSPLFEPLLSASDAGTRELVARALLRELGEEDPLHARALDVVRAVASDSAVQAPLRLKALRLHAREAPTEVHLQLVAELFRREQATPGEFLYDLAGAVLRERSLQARWTEAWDTLDRGLSSNRPITIRSALSNLAKLAESTSGDGLGASFVATEMIRRGADQRILELSREALPSPVRLKAANLAKTLSLNDK